MGHGVRSAGAQHLALHALPLHVAPAAHRSMAVPLPLRLRLVQWAMMRVRRSGRINGRGWAATAAVEVTEVVAATAGLVVLTLAPAVAHPPVAAGPSTKPSRRSARNGAMLVAEAVVVHGHGAATAAVAATLQRTQPLRAASTSLATVHRRQLAHASTPTSRRVCPAFELGRTRRRFSSWPRTATTTHRWVTPRLWASPRHSLPASRAPLRWRRPLVL